MGVKLLTEQHLEFLSLKGGCTCSSESTLVKMQHCRKSHVAVQVLCHSWALTFSMQFSVVIVHLRPKVNKCVSGNRSESFWYGRHTLSSIFFLEKTKQNKYKKTFSKAFRISNCIKLYTLAQSSKRSP